jgi:hypothetical protein
MLFFKNLRHKYEKVLYSFIKYKRQSQKTIETNRETRLLINKVFKLNTELANNKRLLSLANSLNPSSHTGNNNNSRRASVVFDENLNSIDVNILRLLILQKTCIISYPRKEFINKYVQVDLKYYSPIALLN